MTNSRIKSTLLCAVAGLAFAGCVGIDNGLGGSMIPIDHTYKVASPDPIGIPVDMKMPDSLSAYSSTRITIGAIRDADFGLTTRACCLTLVPIFGEEGLDFGTAPEFRQFHFSAIRDTLSVADKNQASILQNVRVYELDQKLDQLTFCNSAVPHGTASIAASTPILNGTDSLSFNFSKAYGEKYLTITADDVKNMDAYLARFPGIYITTDEPAGNGGRINIFQLQLGYDTNYGYLTGSYAELKFRSKWEGDTEPRDTSFFFYFSATKFADADSLFSNAGTGSFPQKCANLTGHGTSAQQGPAAATIKVEGGSGLKPLISAVMLRNQVRGAIAAAGDNPDKAVINKATLTFRYDAPDANYENLDWLPQILSPTCRISQNDTVRFMGLTDASDSSEDQGDVHYYPRESYSPNITYHVQQLIRLEDDNADLLAGNYDIWLLPMHYDQTTTTTSGNSEISDYYNYLAYQSYYNNMYGGYGGYGYGGYGYGYDSYSNYYNYALMAQYYGSSSTSTSTSANLDRDRYYKAILAGPAASEAGRRPTLSFTYSVPNE